MATPAEINTYCRNIHNAASDDNWSDSEIYTLIRAASNACLSIIGLGEGVDTSITTVDGTKAYTVPTDVVTIQFATWDGRPLKKIDRKEYILRNPTGVDATGTPHGYWIWANSIYLEPTPSDAATLQLFTLGMQPTVSAATTLLVPEIFHIPALAEWVIAQMFMKDKDLNSAQFYMSQWQGVHIPSMRKYISAKRRGGGPLVVADADSLLETDAGVV